MHRPPAGNVLRAGGGSDGRRIAVLAVLAVLFLGGVLYFQYVARRPPGHEGLSADAADVRDAAPIRREPSARVDVRRLEDVHDATRIERQVREPGAYAHLLGEARKLTEGDLEALGMTPADGAALRADSASLRGKAVDVKGTLERLDAVQGERFREFRGTLRSQAGEVFAFTVLREPEAAIGDVVRLKGFFFKLFASETAPGLFDDEMPYVVGCELIRSCFPLEPVADLSAIAFDGVRDRDLAEMADRQEDLLWPVLGYARTVDAAERAALPYREVAWVDLRKDPEQYRGQVVQVVAKFPEGFQWQQRLGPRGENPLGVDVFVEGIVAGGQDMLMRWIGFEPIRDEQVGDFRNVVMTGVFFKNLAWENTRGEVFSGPLLVPLRVEPFRVQMTSSMRHLGTGIAIAAVVIAVVFAASAFAENRRSAEFRRESVRRRKRSLERALTAGPGDGRAPDAFTRT